MRSIVFTDLDGTLLDHYTYSWDAARPALERLRRLQVTLIPCTSKTAAEVRELATALPLAGPWIVENGGGIRIPRGFLRSPPDGARLDGGKYVVDLGMRYEEILAALEQLRSRFGFEFRGFSTMSVEDVAYVCGLPPEDAERAKQREYDEPLLLEDSERVSEFARRLRDRGLELACGGRFFHVSGGSHKGRAVRVLLALLGEDRGPLRSVGLGDSPNDLPMLRAVDLPIIVPKPHLQPDPALVESLPNHWTAPLPGPAGWNDAVLRWLEQAAD